MCPTLLPHPAARKPWTARTCNSAPLAPPLLTETAVCCGASSSPQYDVKEHMREKDFYMAMTYW